MRRHGGHAATSLIARTDEDEPEHGPLRRCVVTRERLAKERMIRFVVGAGSAPWCRTWPQRLPGRGIG